MPQIFLNENNRKISGLSNFFYFKFCLFNTATDAECETSNIYFTAGLYAEHE